MAWRSDLSGERTETMPQRARLLSDAHSLRLYLRDVLARQQPPAIPASVSASARAAAVLAPLFARDGRPYLLFTRRSADLTAHRGEISFPGGSRDVADISLEATALRETEEELGFATSGVDILGALPHVHASISNFLIAPFAGWLGDELPELRPNIAEVAEVIVAPLESLADPSIHRTELWRRGGEEHLVHFFDFGSYCIWGATGRMLDSLLRLLPPAA